MYNDESGWMMKDNFFFYHVCYWIDANVEWLIELELERSNLKNKDLLLLLFGRNKPLKPKALHV